MSTLRHTSFSCPPAFAVVVAALVIGFAMDRLPDAVFMPLFCRLPARIAAGYYGAPLSTPDLAFCARGVGVTVARGCGGAGFFALCAALLATLSVNAMRIVFIVPVTAAARLAPESLRAGIHMAAGMAVFMSAFAALWVFTERPRPRKASI